MSENFFDEYTWEKVLSVYPARPREYYDIARYQKILCPEGVPQFLEKYIALSIVQRLKGVGLLCGTDWTPLYRNRFYYSRFDHSVSTALIIYHFTHDKAETIAGLLHDVATPVFSHVGDFRKGDTLTQTTTESETSALIKSDDALLRCLAEDKIAPEQVADYHAYPIADNEIPRLSADRLEYMFPSGMALEGSWTLDEIEKTYRDIVVLKNEDGVDELGFSSIDVAENYCEKFCMIGHVLQLNENKLALNLLGEVMNRAEKIGLLSERDFMEKSEREIIEILTEASTRSQGNCCKTDLALSRLLKTFRTMTKIEHTDVALENHYCVNLEVKQRYINPLVVCHSECAACHSERTTCHSVRDACHSERSEESPQSVTVDAPNLCDNLSNYKVARLTDVSARAKKIVSDFLLYKDTSFGCARLASLVAKIAPSILCGKVNSPPSKSFYHRILISSALAGSDVEREMDINKKNASQDILATLDCIAALNSGEKNAVYKCRESGSTLRFFIPIALAKNSGGVFSGSGRLIERGVEIYEKVLSPKGISFEKSENAISVFGALKSGVYEISGSVSSQYISGLMFALPLLDGDSVIKILPPVESRAYIDITIDVLKTFGVEIVETEKNVFAVKGNQVYQKKNIEPEGDWSNAAFFYALKNLGNKIEITGLNENSTQGDKSCKEFFDRLDVPNAVIDISENIDLGPILFAYAAAKNGGTFTGTKRLRIKESDRANAMAAELKKFGAEISVCENEVVVTAASLNRPTEILDGHNDHRIVMSLAVLLCVTGGEIEGIEAVTKSYPNFFDELRRLGANVEIR